MSESVLKGIVDECLQSQVALIGGETAEMPGMYQPGDYDLARFSVGEVKKADLNDGLSLKEGDSLVAIASSGVHFNGYSLVRKILETKKASIELKIECLVPTKIYVKTILAPLETQVKGIANITGSGFLNIPRINDHVKSADQLPKFMEQVCELSGLDEMELHRTFNMGVGMVVATDRPDEVIKSLLELGESAFLIGSVTKGSGKIFLGVHEL